MREFYFYSERPINNIIEEAFIDFKIHSVSMEFIKKNILVNKNILLVLNENLPVDLHNSILLKNNVVIFFKQNKQDKKKYFNTKVFRAVINLKKFIDEVKNFYASKPFVYKNIVIEGEKLINPKDEKEVFLTTLEKDILVMLFDRAKIEKKLLLESVLKLKIDTETKTLESHLTRIRKKLISINSQIEIISRENTIFLVG